MRVWRPLAKTCTANQRKEHDFNQVSSLTPYDLTFPPKSGSICPQYTRLSLQRVIRVGFSGTADRTALFTVRTNPRWRPPPSWKNFKWPYLRNRSSDPLHVLFYGGVFGDGGSNGAIFDSNKFKMAAAAILDNLEFRISATAHDLLI